VVFDLLTLGSRVGIAVVCPTEVTRIVNQFKILARPRPEKTNQSAIRTCPGITGFLRDCFGMLDDLPGPGRVRTREDRREPPDARCTGAKETILLWLESGNTVWSALSDQRVW